MTEKTLNQLAADLVVGGDNLNRLREENAQLRDEVERLKAMLSQSVPNGMADALSDEIGRIKSEVERLRKVADALPKTADGVPIVPGMKLYPLQPLPKEELDDEEDYAVVEMIAKDSWAGEVIEAEDLPNNYSTAEAALKAFAGMEKSR